MNTKPRLSPDAAARRHRTHVIVAMTLYLVTLLICTKLLKATPPGALQITLALVPTLPVIWVMGSLYRFLMQADELQRRVHLEALAVAAGITAFFSLTYGFLEQFAGFPHIAAWWTFVLIDLVWGAYGCVLWCRYK
ncbi:MAG TPA: hypothetical protein VHP13_07875 [Gammaproteobacteria bacterium]|jgi:low temperature requirement protein LtrA|nr:hypothetical protein [Gammaproteobacteria bacterium]